MSPPRRGEPGRARTAEERERDRLERERRRAREHGSSSPVSDAAAEPLFDPAAAGLEPPAPEPRTGRGHPGHPPDFADSDEVHPADGEPPAYGQQPAYGGDHPAHSDHRPPEEAAWMPRPAVEPEVEAYPEGPPPPAGLPPARRVEGGRRAARPGGERSRAARSPRSAGTPANDAAAAALARVGAALSGARAALSGAAEGAAARLTKPGSRSSQTPPPAGDRPPPSADSLPTSVRARTARRTPVRPGPGARPRPRPRPRPGPRPVSKTKSNLTGPADAPRSPRGRIAAGVALVVVVIALWFLFSLFQPFKGGGQGSVSVDIPRGSSSSAIATLLADRGVISSGFFFKLRATLAGKRSELRSGHFDLRRDMSYGSALTALTSGRQGIAAQIKVTIPEGLARTEISAVIRRAGVTGDYVRASVHSHVLKPATYGGRSAHSLEGFLFPSTYDLLPGDPASKLVNAQLNAFKSNLAAVDLSRARGRRLSVYEVLIIASMVEREAQLASERPLIAAVIYNRLHSGMPLGIDATIRYAINDYSRPLTVSDLRRVSPYNTRLHQGLPPTPIGNPGLASIQAAAHPAAVQYQYYVVKPGTCGQHAFSSTFAQFQQDVARYNSARAAKGGNSPTTCAH